MFYSQFILAKKGPLGTIWIAAHLERKLRKNQVADTDIGVSVDSILFPEMPIALRLSSHLLLGVVRIYSRKVNYLFDDCSEALLKIKQAFRSTAVDLPPEESTAPYHSITLPETFDLDDFELPDNDIFQGNFIDHHVSTREQITLQDRIDGAVYSTSQFGLDEQFGDGDTSQIGLEIDEELYLDKVVASSDNAQASVQPHTTLQNGRSDEEITDFFDRIEESHGNEIASAFTETKDEAGGPLTPGLQELKISSAQEALLSDDHVEADWSYSTDLGSLKSAQCLQGTSSIDQQEKDRELESLHDEMENEKYQKEHPINNMLTREQECMLADEHSSMSLFAMPEQKYPLPKASESAYRIVNDVNSSGKVEDKLDGGVINNQPFVTVKDGIGLESERASEAVVSPCLSLVTSESEDPGHNGIFEMGVIPVLEFNCVLEDDQTCQKVESSMNNMQISNSEGGSYPQCEGWTAATAFQLGSPGAPVVDVESHREPKEIGTSKPSPCDIVPCNKLHVLHSCSSHLCHPGISFGGKNYASDQISGPLCQELQSDSRKLSQQFENERLDQSEDLSKSATSDLQEPEKILYLPHGPGRSTNAMPIESLPDFTAGGEDSFARAKSVSGKKRSFTESTITLQSFNSVESFGVSQPRTTEIPDDDDLLSSILVGRRSSIVRIKSTPAALGAASSKRPRTTNWSNVSKRKVLMDDAMVLHGDMIRQQLTSNEDIRRIRRKAPCTCSEILTIQRQFLEDEIFCEPVFTGMSRELIYLHGKTFDLRGTAVYESIPNNTFLETYDNRESNMSTSGTERDISSRPDGEHQLLASDVKALHTEIAFSNKSHQTKHKLGLDDTPCHALEEIISDANSVEICQHSEVMIAVLDSEITNDKLGSNNTPCHVLTDTPSDSNLETSKHADVHISGKDVEMTVGMDAPVVHGLEVSITCDPVYVDNCKIQDGGSTIVENNNNCEGCFKQISVFSTGTNVVGSVTMEDELLEDKCAETIILVTENDENDIGKEVRTDRSESNTPELVTTTKECQEFCTPSINLHQHVNGIGNANLCCVNVDEVPSLEYSCQEKDPTIYSEKSTAYSIEFDFDKEDHSLNDEENQILHEDDNQITTDEFNCHLVDVFYDDSAAINDTGFLNVENDVDGEEDDGIQCAEGAQNLENSGWSSRTRAVANYLQTLFDKEALVGRKNLRLDNLLTDKTRKEASRMFFETLVLKTKDYIHVEQIHSYDVVLIKPRPKLMNLEF